MKTAIAIAALLALTSCTYGEQKRVLQLDDLISADESKAAILVEHRIVHSPTGIAAFPDGGHPKTTDHALDVYVVGLASRKILYRHAIDPPAEWSKSSFSASLLGWEGDDVYVKLTGCMSGFRTSYKGCGPEWRKARVYRISRHAVDAADRPSSRLVRKDSFGGARPGTPSGARSYLSSDDRSVWIQYGMRGPREALLVINGRVLEDVVD